MYFKDLTDFPENYGYLNARLRAHFSDFLGREDYRRLAGKSLEGIEVFLLETRYGKSFRKGLVEQPLSAHRRIEMALGETAADSLSHARKMAMGEPEDLLMVILSSADLHNGRLLLRFFFTGAIYDGNPLWHGYGTLPVSFFRKLWSSHSISHVIDRCLAFPHPLSRPLGKACSELRKGVALPASERVLLTGILAYLNVILDRHRSKDSGIVRDFLGRSIDIWNMNTWSRVISGSISKEKAAGLYIEKGSYLSIEKLNASAYPNQLLRSTPWEEILARSPSRSVAMIVSRATKLFWLWQISLRRRDPLGIGVAIGYCAHQLVEWQNLNALVVGIDMGLGVDSIMDKMIIPG
ncbi:MAG: V-type ATPase subunit [Thermovirgaceae bacterium]|nr:V-type ATPase subunit [Thermovirgaceae bacterium]